MSLEEKIVALTEAVKANTAALGGKAAPAASGDAPKAKPGPKPKAKPTKTADEVKAIIVRVKNEVGSTEAQELIATVVGTEGAKLAELMTKPELFDAAYAAAEEALAGGGEEAAEDDDI